MLIYVDSKGYIRAINETTCDSLICIEINRNEVFGNFSDFMILNYRYIEQGDGYVICPTRDYDELLYLENKEIIKESQNKISILEAENKSLKVEQTQQNDEILVNMLANTEMFEMILGMMPVSYSINENTKNSGGSSMVEVYVTLILKGVKTIDDVPMVIRAQVEERLKQLEVPVK